MSNHLKGVGAKDVRNTYRILFHDHLKSEMKSSGRYEKKKDKLILLTILKL